MKALRIVLLSLTMLLTGSALARPSVPLTDVVDQPIATASGKAITLEQVQEAIRAAAEARKWTVTPVAEGKLIASLSWNANKHTIVVDIAFSNERYSITYRDSVNMRYSAQDGKPEIHPHYNRFVGELRDAIRVELMKY